MTIFLLAFNGQLKDKQGVIMKQTGIYFIIGGAILFVIIFIGKIISFILNNPLLGLSLLAILVGVAMILTAIYQERKADPESEELKEVKQ